MAVDHDRVRLLSRSTDTIADVTEGLSTTDSVTSLHASARVVNPGPLEDLEFRISGISPCESRPDNDLNVMWTHSCSTPQPIAIDKINLANSPRVRGIDIRHIQELIEAGITLPPIVVNRETMEVIDGAHRLMAARKRGESTINVSFFDGSETDAFLFAVQVNAEQGLPLSREDRLAATHRILETHGTWSDRMIAELVGLSTKTVASIRSCSTEEDSRLNKRLGRDGKMRPVDSSNSRQRAAELFKSNPNASLREVARAVGLSPATVKDVKNRMSPDETSSTAQQVSGCVGDTTSATVVDVLLNSLRRDPSIRSNEDGRALLRLLVGTVNRRNSSNSIQAIPAHQVSTVVQVAKVCANMWQDFATQLATRDVPPE
ncbi:ParB/RepB/Spo0J family partition protein [Nocardia sp. PE-7]|uniref:ParB/RepB/Spo0J family partition protein n=1 Tax=Nocardia sp. PE-7 TaxID=3058426 RepID=UPI00265B5E9E|nr:ParB/RepB/Spo0J family partition protein [Nocardia sp. PE-7]WKG09627.1 ParB/RepB/Spo0J family partition protein [Nocardia sp. PE-7]